MLSLDTILQNRYRITAKLGQGGMGTVYKAIDQRLSLTVAIKETFAVTEELRRAFEREARLLANLNHSSLPRVIDHFTEGEGQYLVMDYVSGDDLGTMLAARKNPFSVDEVIGWGRDLLEVLDYLHSSDPPILHRDIKPTNIKLSARGKVILLDFGLAKGKAGEMTEAADSRSIYGFSPNYASPEQTQGDRTSEQSDLHSLALTLYNLLTGIKPPDALTRVTTIINDEKDPLLPIQYIIPALPGRIAQSLMSATALRVSARPKSAKEMLSVFSGNYPNQSLAQPTHSKEEETVVRSFRNPATIENRQPVRDEKLKSVIWKLGCNWGGMQNPSFYNFIKQKGIVIGIERLRYSKGDLILISEGFTVKAIARVEEDPKTLSRYSDYTALFNYYKVADEHKPIYAGAEWYELNSNEIFQYKVRVGGTQVTEPEIKELAFKLWNNRNRNDQNKTTGTKLIITEEKVSQVAERNSNVQNRQPANNPVNKKNVLSTDPPQPGETEYITHWNTRVLAYSVLGMYYQTPQENLELLMAYLNSKLPQGRKILSVFFAAVSHENLRFNTSLGTISFSAQGAIDKEEFLKRLGVR